jgi:hypothetical protein
MPAASGSILPIAKESAASAASLQTRRREMVVFIAFAV